MYKPPQNNNRVRCLTNKFESLGQNTSENKLNNGCGNNLIATEKDKLRELQITDSLKMNIKRTPAFRVDRSQAESCGFQQNSYNKSELFESKLRLYTSVKNGSNNTNNLIKDDENIDVTNANVLSSNSQLIYENNENFLNHNSQAHCNGSDYQSNVEKNISSLYTKPISKALRNKNMKHQNSLEEDDKLHKIGNLTLSNSPTQKREIVTALPLTDTLKTALKKPLPSGPAPKKPPRTFQHSQQNSHITKNITQSCTMNNIEETVNIRPKSKEKKTDAKYMLNKLENALRNNKLYVKKQCKSDLSNTSGDDSDESPVFKNKFNKINLDFFGRNNDTFNSSTFNLNCLSSMNCSKNNYEIINEPSSSFFTSDNCDTPTYAEPYHFLNREEDGSKS